MKLNPGERSILAGFMREPHAEAARTELQRAGITEVQLDRISEHGYETGADTRRPALGGGGTSQTGTVLSGAQRALDDDRRVLLAAMPAVSGMAGEVPRDAPFLLTIVTNDQRVEEALAIVRRNHGKA